MSFTDTLTWPLGDLLEGKDAEQFPTVSPSQQGLIDETSDVLSENLRQVMASLNDVNSVFGQAQSALLGELDPTKIMDRWKSLVAEPMMGLWDRMGESTAKERYNLPGAYYSASRGKGVMREGEQFLSESVMPSLFSSMENWSARLPGTATGAAMLRGNVLGQAVNPAIGLGTATTQETIAYQPPDVLGMGAQLGGSAMMAAAMSDRRVKTDIVKSTNKALEKIKKLKAYFYRFKKDETKQFGLMAQDVEAVLPEAVTEIKGVKHIKLLAVIALLVDGINELREEIKNGNSDTSTPSS